MLGFVPFWKINIVALVSTDSRVHAKIDEMAADMILLCMCIGGRCVFAKRGCDHTTSEKI